MRIRLDGRLPAYVSQKFRERFAEVHFPDASTNPLMMLPPPQPTPPQPIPSMPNSASQGIPCIKALESATWNVTGLEVVAEIYDNLRPFAPEYRNDPNLGTMKCTMNMRRF